MKAMAVLFALMLLATCASKPHQYELVAINPHHEELLIKKLALFFDEFYPKDTVFNLKTTDRINQALEKEMRRRGYAFSNRAGKETVIVVDQLDEDNLYLKIVIEKTEFTKIYTTKQERYASPSSWTRLVH
jgi:hypothetical protein